MDSNDNSFWKQNRRAVPGRPSPKKLEQPPGVKLIDRSGAKGGVGSTSFQDFQQSVSDAWDTGDDEFCILSGLADAKISKRASDSAARNVIKTHCSNVKRQELQTSPNANTAAVHGSSRKTAALATIASAFDAPPIKPSLKLEIPDNHNNDHSPMVESQNESDSVAPLSPTKAPDSPVSSSDARPRYRPAHSYPGRPQLIRFSSNLCRDSEHESKIEKFQLLIDAPLLNMIALKELSWSGIPKRMRAVTWRLLSGYLPTSNERRQSVLERKRVDYHNLVAQYFRTDSRDEAQQDTYHQIHIDVPRMNPHVQLFQQQLVQEMFERILFIWAIRHPASGYVQGINDLVTPFFIIFLQEALESNTELDTFKLEQLSLDQRNVIEADSFWCLSKFLDCIQDNYIFAQLGIQAKVNQLKELIQRIDGTLHKQLQAHGIDYLQFSFRWMNNLLTRELPLHCTIRLWDTYLAESDGFAVFQLYVCAAFLLHWREQLLQEQDFQGLMLLLQNLPTHNWVDSHIGVLVAEAFRLKFTYADAPKHLEGKS